ncbi:MAG: hypothetical protein SVZ03_09700 [Spirochaetota bacterium]|nr:hypothetical protein [Spirochaetota bacterium]
MKIPIITIILFISLSALFAQQSDKNDYITYYNNSEYKKALQILKGEINLIYSKRVHDKRVPLDVIAIKKIEEGMDLNELFRTRRAKMFFIEKNDRLFQLHLYSARCHSKLSEYSTALNHYYQALRFKSIEFNKDDVIFYEISQVYRNNNHYKAYLDSLETAYTLKPSNFNYSLELGKALYGTGENKKAIYHLERYIQSMGDTAIDLKLYLMIANLNEDIGRYLETVKYYKKYITQKDDDGYIFFALGYLAYKRIGDFNLAMECFNRSLEFLPENSVFRRSKANEYKGNIYMKELEFEEAAGYYLETIKYQDMIKSKMEQSAKEAQNIENRINNIKSLIIKTRENDKYEEYNLLREKKGEIELANREIEYQYKKLNAGKVRWNLARIYENVGNLNDAIKFYRDAVSLNYNSEAARERIKKIQLKIKRGY